MNRIEVVKVAEPRNEPDVDVAESGPHLNTLQHT
jgi:hypothetical protein